MAAHTELPLPQTTAQQRGIPHAHPLTACNHFTKYSGSHTHQPHGHTATQATLRCSAHPNNRDGTHGTHGTHLWDAQRIGPRPVATFHRALLMCRTHTLAYATHTEWANITIHYSFLGSHYNCYAKLALLWVVLPLSGHCLSPDCLCCSAMQASDCWV